MSKKPLVSIALCTYNGEEFLKEQLDTLVLQTYPNKEIIVVDDGSIDGTLEILENYSVNYPCLKVFKNEKNMGYVKNFEKAITLCNGEYIALSDQDDIWSLNKIELLVDNIEDYALIYHDSEFINHKGISLEKKISDILNMYQGDLPHPFFFYNCVSGHSMLFKGSLRDSIIPFDKNFFHDWWIAALATERGGIKYYDQPLVKYRQHLASNTDILNKRKKPKVNDKRIKEINLDWIHHLKGATISYKEVLNDLIICFNINQTVKHRYKLLKLMLSYYKLLFFIKKKSSFSKLNYIRKICLSNV